MTVLSTNATSGTEILDRIMGAASAHTRRWVGRSRQSANRKDMQAPLRTGIVERMFTRAGFDSHLVGAGLARDWGDEGRQADRVVGIASKPAPTEWASRTNFVFPGQSDQRVCRSRHAVI